MPATNATNSVFPSLVPTEVRALFGDPPLLRGEEASLYNNLMDQFSRLVEPKDMIEWWWVKDITDHVWEIRRLRRFKILCVELERDAMVDQRGMFNVLRKEGEEIKPVPVPESEKDSAECFTLRIDQYKGIDKLIASAELRRDRTLREVERRHENLARRLRKASDEIVK